MKNTTIRLPEAFRRSVLRCTMVLPFLAATPGLHAQTFSWNTGYNGNWGDAASWANAAVPGSADAAVINDGGTATVNGTFSVGSLTVGGTNNGKTSTLYLDSRGPGILSVTSSPLNVGVNGGTGVLTILQDTRVSPVAPRVDVATINLGDGGTLNFRYTQSPARFTLTNNITGSGAKVNFLGGDVILTGNNTYTAPTKTEFILFIRDGGSLGGGNYGGNIELGTSNRYGVLQVQAGRAQALNGEISGRGAINTYFNGTVLTLNPTNIGGNSYDPVFVAATDVSFGATLRLGGNNTGSVVGPGRFDAKNRATVISITNNPMGLDVDATSPKLIFFDASQGYATWDGGGFSNALTTVAVFGGSSLTNGIWHKNRPGIISASGLGNTIGGTFILRGTNGTTNFTTFYAEPGATLEIAANLTNDSGDYAFEKVAAGMLILSGSNSYTGTTLISQGTLSVGNGGTTGNLGGGTISNNAVLLLNRSDSILVTNDISGTGSLVKAGAGTATMSGANTYSGATTINAGTLRVGDAGTAGTLGTGEVSVSNNAVLMIDRSDNITLASIVSGAGSLRKVGANTLTLSGQNTYTGGTVISNGTLSVTSPSGLANNASNTVTVASGATFSLDATDVFGRHTDPIRTPIVINGGTVQSGGAFYNALGPITMNGGTLVATAVEAASGYSFSLKDTVTVNSNSTISGPGITLGSAGVNSTAFNVAGGATLTISNGLLDGPGVAWPSDQPSSLVKSGAGSLLLAGTNTYTGDTTISNGTVAVTGSGLLNNGNYDGNINLAAAGSTLVVDTTENQSLGGIISGSGALVKANTGTLTITGSDNAYAGTTTIGGGTLALNGTHTGGGAYTVQSGATLKGEGRTASAVIVESGGNITPGNSPGELTIGDLTLNGTLNIFIDGDSTSLLTVLGNANVTGGGVSFTSGAAPTEDVYVFLNASGTLTSPFATNSGLSGALASYQLLYDANDGIAFLKLNSVTNVVEAIFPGPNAVIGSGTTNFNVYVYNGGTNPLAFSASGVSSNNTFGSIAATNVTSSNGVELSSLTFSNGSGTFGTNTASFNAVLDGTTNATSFDVVVYDHASNVVTGTNFNFGAVHAGFGTVTSTNSVTVSNKNDSFRIAMGVTNDNTNAGIIIDSVGGLAQGDAAELFATLDTSAVAPGRFTNNAGLVSYDDSDLNGASTNLGTVGVQLTGYIYTGQGVWTGSGGDWQDFDDWQEPGGTPGLDGNLSVNDTALFGTDGSGPVTLNTNAELLSVTFSNASTPYVLSGTGTLVLTASGTNPATINTLAGSHTISNAVEPGSDLVLSNTAATGLTLSGVVSGVNGLVKTGAGTTTLSASNTYQGGTVIADGTLVAATSTALSTGEVTFTDSGSTNASLLVDGSGGVTVISNTINVLGVATIGSSAIFDAANPLTFAGPIILSTNVTLVSAAKTGTFGDRTDFSGGISGTGDVTISTAPDSRVIFMGNPNTFTGDLFITEGSTLQLSDGTTNANSLIPITAVVDVATNAFLKFAKGDGNSEVIAGLTGPGTVDAAAGSNNLVLAPDAGISSTFSGVIQDGAGTMAVAKSGAGKQTFSGNNTYTGGTTIFEGTLATASSTALGTGPVELLAGTLELQSPLNIASLVWDGGGGATKIAIPTPGANFLTVTSPISLLNGVNNFNLTGATLSGPVKLLAAPGVSTNSLSLFGVEGVNTNKYKLTYIGDELWLTLITRPRPKPEPEKPAYPDFTQFAGNRNQMEVAKALNQWAASGPSGDRKTVLDAMTNSGDYGNAFNQMMPTIYESIGTTAFNLANVLNTSLFERLWLVRVNGEGFSSRGLAPAPLQGETGGGDDFIVKPPKNWGVFVDGYGVFANANGAQSMQNYDFQSGGVTGGASYKWNDNFSTGVYAGYQGLQAQYDNGGRLTDNAVRFGGFGTLLFDNFFLNSLVGGAYHNYQVDRSIEFGSIDRTASGDPAAGEFDFAVGGGYDFKAGNFVFGPTTSLQYTYLNVQGFEESGADSLNLKVDGYDTSSLLYSLGGQVAYNWKLSQKVVITPRLTAGWQHEFLQNAYPINSAFATGGPVTPFSYQTTSPIRDYFYGGASVALGIDDTWETAFFYNAIANQDLVSHSIYFSIGAKF